MNRSRWHEWREKCNRCQTQENYNRCKAPEKSITCVKRGKKVKPVSAKGKKFNWCQAGILAVKSRRYKLKLSAETCAQRRCEASFSRRCMCNMVDFVKLFRTPVARQVSRKVEPLSTSATARNGRSGEKTRVSPCSTTSWNWSRSPLHTVSAKSFNG